jgi:hypothetical protein
MRHVVGDHPHEYRGLSFGLSCPRLLASATVRPVASRAWTKTCGPARTSVCKFGSGHCAGSPCTQAQRRSFSSPVMVRPRGGLGLFVLCRMAGRAGVCPPRLTPSCQTPSVLGRVSWRLVRDARLKRQSDGQRVPSAQVLDRLAVLPLDGVLEKVSKSAAGGDAGDVGHAAACAHGDDEAFVMEGECLQRPLL